MLTLELHSRISFLIFSGLTVEFCFESSLLDFVFGFACRVLPLHFATRFFFGVLQWGLAGLNTVEFYFEMNFKVDCRLCDILLWGLAAQILSWNLTVDLKLWGLSKVWLESLAMGLIFWGLIWAFLFRGI